MHGTQLIRALLPACLSCWVAAAAASAAAAWVNSHPAVVSAIQAQAAEGVHFFSLNESAVKLAEMVVDAVPCAEHVRFANTGVRRIEHTHCMKWPCTEWVYGAHLVLAD